jgi:hypothetical protein
MDKDWGPWQRDDVIIKFNDFSGGREYDYKRRQKK